MLAKTGAVLLVVLAFFLYVTRFHPLGSIPLAPPSISLGSLSAAAIASASTTLPSFTGTGVYFVDATHVPYFLYETTAHRAAVKELIFGSANSCAVEAGGYSCVAPLRDISTENGKLVPGAVAYIEGATEAQAIKVNDVSPASLTPGMQIVTIAAELSGKIGDLTILPRAPKVGASCTLGEGCAAADTIRVPATITTPGKHGTEFTEGALYAVGGKRIILLSAHQEQGTWVYTFVIADN